jgi:hypothetical protein
MPVTGTHRHRPAFGPHHESLRSEIGEFPTPEIAKVVQAEKHSGERVRPCFPLPRSLFSFLNDKALADILGSLG